MQKLTHVVFFAASLCLSLGLAGCMGESTIDSGSGDLESNGATNGSTNSAANAGANSGTGSNANTNGGTGTKAAGEACSSGSECASGFCPADDGVCCDTACDGECVACSAAKTGGADGACAPVAADTDPDAECADEGAQTCGSNGTGCNGELLATACNTYPAGTLCGASTCASETEASSAVCSGDGVCNAGANIPCAPFACDSGECRTDCSTDADCVGDASCVNGSCGLLPPGAACSDASKCASGNCADGVCCDTACGATCMACDLAGSEGQCTDIPTMTDPDDECAQGMLCDGAGMCVAACAGAGPATTPLDSEEQAFLAEINAYRATNGLGQLENCTSLSRAAQGHSEDMRDQNYFSHTGLNGSNPYERSCDACYDKGCGPRTAMAENIAAGNSTGSATFTQWKNSPGHNANMLGGSYTQIGIGRATGGGRYGTYWTTVFAAADEMSCD